MRRRNAAAAVLAAALAFLGAGCFHSEAQVVSPTAEDVEGKITSTKADPAKGGTIFAKEGCGGCHRFAKAEGANGTVGPNLDELAEHAKEANRGSVEDYARESIVNPNAYVVPGFPPGVMPPYQLQPQDLANLVAFLTQG